ncbi:MAG: hypothetical protein KDC34_02525 [Saprospiraceae bacterium]|nr:hypothetical protein [Saprospiraceae bacterium]
MKTIITVALILVVSVYIFFRSWDYLIKYKNRQAGKKYCREKNLKFLNVKSYELHSRLYFEKDGVEGWANYKTDRDFNIIWKKETPVEKLELMKNIK